MQMYAEFCGISLGVVPNVSLVPNMEESSPMLYGYGLMYGKNSPPKIAKNKGT